SRVAPQHEVVRRRPGTRGPRFSRDLGPGSAVHRCASLALHCIRDTADVAAPAKMLLLLAPMAGTKQQKRAAREERLRAALRENLKRRKAQARGRERPDPPDEDKTVPDPERTDASKHS